MTKEQILATLKEKIGETSLSDRTIDAYVTSFLPEEGTEPDAEYFERHASILKSLSGQFNHDVATTIEEYKKKNNPSKPNDPPKKKEEKEGLEEILARMEKLEKQNDENTKRLLSEQMKNELLKKSASLTINNKNLWEDEVNGLDYSLFKSADEAFEKVKTNYEEKLTRYTPGAKPFGASGGDPNTPDQAEMEKRQKAYLDSLPK